MTQSLDINAIRDYLIKVGYKIEYPILVHAFKQHLYNPNPEVQGKIRTLFKDYVNRLATVSLENNMKFIILREEFQPKETKTARDTTDAGTSSQEPPLPQPQQQVQPAEQQPIRQLPHSPAVLVQQPSFQQPLSQSQHLHTQQHPTLEQQNQHTSQQQQSPPKQQYCASSNQNQQQQQQPLPPPPPTPRREKKKSASSAGIENGQGRLQHQHSIKSLQPILMTKQPINIMTTPSNGKSISNESDSSSLQPIDPLRRKWVIEACNCNYNGLLLLLREDPKLASYKDIVNGYTALHWAAKFGNLDIINLIAGTCGVSPNIKSSAGHTPLHVACLFKKYMAADLLVKIYKADPQIRDYNGKRPMLS